MSNPATLFRDLLIAASVVAVAGLAGCSSGPLAKRDAQVRAQTSPELETLSQRPIDVSNTQTLVSDENLRMANEDMNRLWLMDRPSRLARWRMPH